MTETRFENLSFGQVNDLIVLSQAFSDDTTDSKVDLGHGSYKTDTGCPFVLPVVSTAEKALVNDDAQYKEYLPCLGLDLFRKLATELLLGKESSALLEQRAFGIQVLGGTGGLRVGAEFLMKIMNYDVVYMSQPTWDNHKSIFEQAGFEDIREYRYWKGNGVDLDFEGMVEDLKNAPENSIIILQTSGHNPTGCDPTERQWEIIREIVQENKLFPFFDCCYYGFVSGNIDEDVWCIRNFVEKRVEFFCSYSFSKTFLVDSERVGNLVIVLNDVEHIPRVRSYFLALIRSMYSNPPSHGAKVISFILNNSFLFEEWKKNLSLIFSRITKMRRMLRDSLEALTTPGDWSFLTSQSGMFSCIEMNNRQYNYMIKKHHVYLLKNGRINICGLTPNNVEYVAKAINDTICLFSK